MRGQVYQKLREKPQYIAITLTCIILFAAHIGSGRVTLDCDDDIAVNLLAAGVFSPDSQYLVYINVLYGWFLKALYLMIPSVNWFLWCSLVQNLLAVTSISLVFGRKLHVSQGIVLAMLFSLFFSNDFYLYVHYTRNVSLYATAGFLWLLLAVKQKHKAAMAAAVYFIVLAAMFRKDAFFITVPLFLSVFVMHWFFHERTDKTRAARALLTAAIPVLIALAVIGADAAIYAADSGWSRYRTRKAVLAEIQDRGVVDYVNHTDLYDAAGFRVSAMNMITYWLDNDPEFFSLERLRDLSAVKQSYDAIHLRFDKDLLLDMARYVTGIMLMGHTWLPTLFLAALCAMVILNRKKQLWMYLANCVLWFAMYYYLFCYSRLAWHVEIAIWMPATLLPLGDLLTETAQAPAPVTHAENRMYLVLAGVLSVIWITYFIPTYQDPWAPRFVTHQTVIQGKERSQALYGYIRADREHFYIGGLVLCEGYWGAESSFDIDYTHQNDFENICHLGNWIAGSPAGMYHANARGITNPMRALFEREDTLLVSSDEEAQRIIYFLQDNYRPDITAEKIDEVSGAGIWRISAP